VSGLDTSNTGLSKLNAQKKGGLKRPDLHYIHFVSNNYRKTVDLKINQY